MCAPVVITQNKSSMSEHYSPLCELHSVFSVFFWWSLSLHRPAWVDVSTIATHGWWLSARSQHNFENVGWSFARFGGAELCSNKRQVTSATPLSTLLDPKLSRIVCLHQQNSMFSITSEESCRSAEINCKILLLFSLNINYRTVKYRIFCPKLLSKSSTSIELSVSRVVLPCWNHDSYWGVQPIGAGSTFTWPSPFSIEDIKRRLCFPFCHLFYIPAEDLRQAQAPYCISWLLFFL